MRRARIVELAAAVGLSGLAAVVAFLFVPLDRGGNGADGRPPTANAHGKASSAPAEPAEPAPTLPFPPPPAEASPSSEDALDDGLLRDMAAGSQGAYRYHPPVDLRLSPVGTATDVGGDSTGARFHRAIRERILLLDDPDGELAGEVLFLLGASFHALGDMHHAADYYEAFARHDPGADGAGCVDAESTRGLCPDAPAALENAVLFREALGQRERALEDAELFVESYSETRIEDAIRVSEHAGRLRDRAGDAAAAVRHHRRHARGLARHGSAGASIRARVRLGAALWRTGDRRAAGRAFRGALSAWRRGAAEEVASLPDRPGTASGAEFSRTLEAVAEAGFHLAELRYDAFRGIDPPLYAGDGSAANVERWVARELRPWVARRLRALGAARGAYDRVVELGVTEWQIAARARQGRMYQEMMDHLRHAPVPAEIRGEGELEWAVGVGDDWRSRPIRRLQAPAIEAFERCLETAIRTRHYGPWSEECAHELGLLSPARHPEMAELRRKRPHLREDPAHPEPTTVPVAAVVGWSS